MIKVLKWIAYSIIFILFAGCSKKNEKSDYLIYFSVNRKSLLTLNEIKRYRNKGLIGSPQNIKTKQYGDTLEVSFELVESAANGIVGGIDIVKDTVIIEAYRTDRLREYTFYQYQYLISNPQKIDYKIVIKMD